MHSAPVLVSDSDRVFVLLYSCASLLVCEYFVLRIINCTSNAPYIVPLPHISIPTCHFLECEICSLQPPVRHIVNTVTVDTWFRGKTRTFKPHKDVPEGTKQYQLRKYAEATLVSPYRLNWLPPIYRHRQGIGQPGNLRLAVVLPEGEDLNEWLAVHGIISGYGIAPYCLIALASRWFLQSSEYVIRNNYWVLHAIRGDRICRLKSNVAHLPIS